MRIESSTITMAASRNYSAEATEQQITITRSYEDSGAVSARASVTHAKISEFEAEGGIAVFTSSAGDGIARADKDQISYTHDEAKPLKDRAQGSMPQMVSFPRGSSWVRGYSRPSYESPESTLLRRLLELLERITGKKYTSDGSFEPSVRSAVSSDPFRSSVSHATARYQETMAMFNDGAADAFSKAVSQPSRSNAVNGRWTRQTIQSGFVAGQENTAFHSSGTVVTSDGRTFDLNISLEMSRSFEAAYLKTSKEEVYTDPLVINMDADAAQISDVSFYFDLNCDGVEEELSSLDASSGFLALDKNGDGEINNGSELFGARTGDGFGELASYDQDGNGWIDEGDEVFSQLKVWVKAGGGDAQLLSLSEADVGAIFLGSQNTRFSLTDSLGETGAMVRKTGLYLRESGTVGTVQHVDFKS